VAVNYSGINTLHPDKQTELMLFRIIQELINNVVKHSQATQSAITFAADGNYLHIEVSDNGKGFTAQREGQGLHSIKQRLQAVGGEIDVDSKENLGTRVHIRMLIA